MREICTSGSTRGQRVAATVARCPTLPARYAFPLAQREDSKNRYGPRMNAECAGINRHGIGNERVQERGSEPS
jgi:hypothetical protein